MTIKTATKIIYLACLVAVTIVPVACWVLSWGEIDMGGMAGFVAATAAPLGALTAAMAAVSISRKQGG